MFNAGFLQGFVKRRVKDENVRTARSKIRYLLSILLNHYEVELGAFQLAYDSRSDAAGSADNEMIFHFLKLTIPTPHAKRGKDFGFDD